MRSVITAALTAASALCVTSFVATAPAAARDYPYCLQGEDWGYPGNCEFVSRDACLAAASGTSADCGLNPSFAFDAGPRHAFNAYAYSPAYPYDPATDRRRHR